MPAFVLRRTSRRPLDVGRPTSSVGNADVSLWWWVSVASALRVRPPHGISSHAQVFRLQVADPFR